MLLLETKNLAKHFGGLKALDGIDMRVERERIVSIIGPNGAGKTTFFNCITGMFRSTRGHAIFRDRDVTGMSPHEITSMGIARTFQNIRLFGQLSVLDNVLAGFHHEITHGFWGTLLRSSRHGREERAHHDQAMELLKTFSLDSRAHWQARNLPYGDQRRLEIARALATSPRTGSRARGARRPAT